MRGRAERYRLMLAHRAAASALEASLKDEAAEEYERERASVTWAWPGQGSIYTSLNQDTAIVTDPDSLLAWVKANRPDQVETIERVRPAYLERLLQEVVPIEMDPGRKQPEDATAGARFCVVVEGDGVTVPGVRWVKGGGLRSVSVKPDPSVTRRMNLAAAAYAAGEGPMPELGS